MNTAAALRGLEALRLRFGPEAEGEKRSLLAVLARGRLANAKQVERFHELLCFMRAYPDSPGVLDAARGILDRFDERKDLRKFRSELADTGIAGTRIHYRFFWSTARWLAKRCPEALSVDWSDFERREQFPDLLGLMVPFANSPALDELGWNAREWVSELKAPGETDGAFLIRRFDSLEASSHIKEEMFERLDAPLRVEPGKATPNRSRAHFPAGPVAYQTTPIFRGRPDLAKEAKRPPERVRALSRADGTRVIDLARAAMVTRQRDLYIFENAGPDDVRLMDFGEGFSLAWIGVVPERRLLFEALYGFLALKNGVPIGYGGASAFMGSSEIFFNAFESFRGGQSATLFTRVVRGARALLGSDTFTLDPYQLGHDNEEAIRSGAWWFYQKLGFRPKNRELLALMNKELKTMKRRPKHRSSRQTLKRLAEENLFLHLGKPRRDVFGLLPLADMALPASRLIAGRFGSDPGKADRVLEREAAQLLGVRSLSRWSASERLWWRRWAPVALTLPGVERWPAARKRALAAVIRAKGGRRESEYARLLDAHKPLRRALLRSAS
jgi:hypothetical protein